MRRRTRQQESCFRCLRFSPAERLMAGPAGQTRVIARYDRGATCVGSGYRHFLSSQPLPYCLAHVHRFPTLMSWQCPAFKPVENKALPFVVAAMPTPINNGRCTRAMPSALFHQSAAGAARSQIGSACCSSHEGHPAGESCIQYIKGRRAEDLVSSV